jgi:mono/diheme cytochrome c family protein
VGELASSVLRLEQTHLRRCVVFSRFSSALNRWLPRPLISASVISLASAGIALTLLHPAAAEAQKKQPQKSAQTSNEKSMSGDAARGKYLVESVAMCGQCHTPRDSEGNPDRSRWLQGGSLPYMPAQADSDWPVSAPRIGGNPPASDADMVKLLTTGVWTTGNRLRYPMPQFRMEKADAEAVVAYLKTVTGKQ